MKLAEYLMRQAFAEENWEAAIVALEAGTGARIPQNRIISAESHPEYFDEIWVEAHNGAITLDWTEHEGFEFCGDQELLSSLERVKISIYQKRRGN